MEVRKKNIDFPSGWLEPLGVVFRSEKGFYSKSWRLRRTESNNTWFMSKTLPDGWLVVVYYSRHIPSRDPVHEVFLAMWHINVWDVLDVLHCINSNLYHSFVCVLFLFYVYFLSLWHCLFEHIWVNSSLNTLCIVFLYSFGHTPVLQVVLAVEASLILWWSNDLWTSCCQVSQKVSE